MFKNPTLIFIPLLMLLASCGGDDDPVIENEEELITEFIYQLDERGGSGSVTLVFSDPDGDGGSDPIIQVSGNLSMNTTYDGSISLSNQANPGQTIDIDAEVADEAEDHQFFYQPSSGLNVVVSYADMDSNGKPLGLLTELTTGTFSSGNLTIMLRHLPNKDADGVTIDNPAGAGGETDISVNFPVSIGN